MRNKILAGLLLAAMWFAMPCDGQVQMVYDDAAPLFKYPEVPEKLTKVNMRSNFMVEHLWDDCNLEKEDITNIASFRETFNDYISFFILADLNVVEKSIDKFIDRVSKNEKNLATVIGFTNTELFSPSAQYWSDDVYAIFAKALIGNKRVDKNVKAELQRNVRIIDNSRKGLVMGDIPLVEAAGKAASLHGLKSECTILFFNVDGCVDCSIYKLRLSTDVVTNRLINAGVVSVVSVYPEGADAASKMASDPETWRKAIVPDLYDTYDFRIVPCVYVLDKDKRIVDKNPEITQLLLLMARVGSVTAGSGDGNK